MDQRDDLETLAHTLMRAHAQAAALDAPGLVEILRTALLATGCALAAAERIETGRSAVQAGPIAPHGTRPAQG